MVLEIEISSLFTNKRESNLRKSMFPYQFVSQVKIYFISTIIQSLNFSLEITHKGANCIGAFCYTCIKNYSEFSTSFCIIWQQADSNVFSSILPILPFLNQNTLSRISKSIITISSLFQHKTIIVLHLTLKKHFWIGAFSLVFQYKDVDTVEQFRKISKVHWYYYCRQTSNVRAYSHFS